MIKKIFIALMATMLSNLLICVCACSVVYNAGDEFESIQTEVSKNYSCNLDELRSLTTSLYEQKKFADLIVIYNKCIEDYPNEVVLYNNIANIYKIQKKYPLALINYEKAIAIDNTYVSPYLGKASLLMLESKYTEAIVTLNTLIQLDPKDPAIYYYKGLTYFFKDNKEKALENYTLAIKKSKGTFAYAYLARGDLYYSYKEDYKKAVFDYTKGIKLLEANVEHRDLIFLDSMGDIYFNRAFAYYSLKEYEKVVKDLQKAYCFYEQENNKAGMQKVKSLLQ